MTVYLYHEAHYREQLAELKERRKEVKRECATINRCISESTFAHMEIPLDVDVENLYMVDVPEFEGNEISYAGSEVYDEGIEYKSADSGEYIESYIEEGISGTELVDIVAELPKIDVAEPEPVVAEASQEETNMISEEICCDGNESVAVELPYELVNKSHEAVDEAYTDLQNFATPAMTKEHYEILTDKEKVEWLGIAECSVQDAIQRFISKLNSIGVVYRYSDDMLDEFMRLESVAAQMKRNGKEQGGKKKEMARAL